MRVQDLVLLQGVLSLLLLINSISAVVTPATIKEKFESKPGARAANLDTNIRLLTVLSLQQNVRHEKAKYRNYQQELKEDGWNLYGAYWYRLFEVDLMWVEAENFCRSMGGHLVSIKDEMENDFVHRLRKKNNIWIGLNKINDPHMVYKWSDGSNADFVNWDSTQPNEPKVDCAYMAYHQEHRGTWFDYGCREMLPQYFMCKIPTP